VVTMFGDDGHVLGSIEAGATGYLLKDASLQRIAASIHELREGGSPISPSIARRVLMKFRLPPVVATGAPGIAGRNTSGGAGTVAGTPCGGPAADASPLSERETEILRLVAKGLSFDTVGGLLDISSHTVVAHVKKIYRKLAVHSRGEAVYEAGQMGLL
jgi:DNA-binding NarL/FixJ family response regulator